MSRRMSPRDKEKGLEYLANGRSMAELGFRCQSRPRRGHGDTVQLARPQTTPGREPMRYSHDRPFRASELGKRAVQYGSRAREQSH